MSVSETCPEIVSEHKFDSIHDASIQDESFQHETVAETSDTLQNSYQGEMTGLQEEKRSATKLRTDKADSIGCVRFRAHFCDICRQSFTRAQSLSRHIAQKHTKLKEPLRKAGVKGTRAKIMRTRKKSKHLENFKKECKLIGNNDTKKIPTHRQTRSQKIKLSSKFQSQKKDNSEETSVGRNDIIHGGILPIIEEEISAINALKDSCDKLENAGQQVLVITSNGEHTQWFGSKYAVQFAQDNSEVIHGFFNYCKEKKEAWKQEMKITIKSESDTKEDIKMGHHLIASDQLTEDNDNNDDGDCGDDCNDDYKLDENNDDDYDVDTDEKNDDSDHSKNAFKTVVSKSKAFNERRDNMFKEIAENLCANEITRDASIVIRRKNGVRTAVYTVAELNRGQYKCAVCGYYFLWKCHLELHQVKNPYCNKTNHSARSENDVLKESITFEDAKTGVEVMATFQELLDSQTVDPISCAVCGKSGFKTRGKLKEHIILHNEINIFECNICCAGFNTAKGLSAHLKEHFKRPYECNSCQWRFTTGQKLKLHIDGGCRTVSLIHDDKNDLDEGLDNITFNCSMCSYEMTGLKNLHDHLSADHKKQLELNECGLCNKRFSDTRLFNSHMLCHSARYSCPYCPKTFSEKSNLFFYHMKTHRNLSEFPYVCDICGEKFKSKRYFDPHRRIHTGERPYKCKVDGCRKSFRSADGLDQHKWCHVSTHFICDFCGRKFKKPSLLNNHRKTHTQEWRYPCVYCEVKFSKLRPFKRHLARVHPTQVEDVKERFKIILHPCNECPKVFFDKEDHTAHMNRHKGIKPFSCKVCLKTFNDKSNLLCHAKLHEGGKKLKCKFCHRRFNVAKFLEDHVARLHTPKDKVSEANRESDDDQDDDGQRLTIALSDDEEDIDQLRESTLQIIDETIRGNVSFD